MKKSEKNIQILLILTGIFLILATYFYYPYTKKKKLVDTQNNQIAIEDNSKGTFFEKVEYNGIYNLNKNFKVNSEKAKILKEEPDIVHMTKMNVVMYLNDGRIVKIFSDKGRYNKVTYDCFFVNNVRATDGDVKILAENLDLIATNNSVKIYNDVNINYPTGSLNADKIDYDFETKYFKVSMFDNQKKVKMKLLK
tara:strand:+ start:114 stop:698 length:585 start_codon:yes stop_codon:yes gene_type:complete